MLKTVEDLEVSRSNKLQLQAFWRLVSTFTFGASYVTRNKGRRASILVGAVSFFLGGASNAGAMNITMLIIESILLSAGI
ncbi:hypothetical protein ES332_D09G056600v1 [Gossypium tomentosum]|uniref:Major facilitator superfamily (MFS) profile domain-containing protein n=1 Tax=Gossypium tomentosum TaxID=34277 RepID=A0A5D2JD51_GOSTO|nr:hypothetical protein ES332_D09G056600v1 [Gossypium tomentosum]